ncbi:hypothetical protein [Marinifilum fragile]|uniref:hypothetical protein n=1 Tax=Marinifilum fragile TaxID=570161 RepID=UPI002AA94994|nr:hypothetical protein [Marinifilum fragile]
MKNRTLIILFLFLSVFSCRSKSSNEKLTIVPEKSEFYINKDSLLFQLNRSIGNEDESLYSNFLIEWNQKFQPNGLNFINQNEVTKSIFEIFKELYYPKSLNELGSWQKDYSRSQNYYVIQNTIKFCIADSPIDTIVNFRPPVILPQSTILYTSKIHNEIYNEFLKQLGKKAVIDLTTEVNPNAQLTGNDKKIELIEKYFPISLDSNLSNWSILSFPYINLITFNKDMNKAKVNFVVGSQGGVAELKKKNEKWIIIESNATWIE